MLRRQLSVSIAKYRVYAPQRAVSSAGDEFLRFAAAVQMIGELQSPEHKKLAMENLWDAIEAKALQAQIVKHNAQMAWAEKLLEEKNIRIAKAEADALTLRANISPVYALRPLIELSCRSLGDPNKGFNANVKSFIAREVQSDEPLPHPDAIPNLSLESQNVLQSLKLSRNLQQEVIVYVNQLYNKLSEPFHAVRNDTHPNGFILGGPAALRYATALVVLKLQRSGDALFPKEVFLLDDKNSVSHVLRDGAVQSYTVLE